MSREALGVLMAGIDATTPDLPRWTTDALAGGLASVCLFAMNTPDLPRTRALTDALRAAGPQVIVAVDEEGGDVTRVQAPTGSGLPGAAALGAVDDVDLTRDCARALGALVGIAGIDLDLAPVLDVASEAANPVIGVRSFGSTPELVTRHGRAFAEGLHDSGTRTCGKHFPGHGSTVLDSHVALPVVEADATTVRDRDLPPFIGVRTTSIMTAHVLVPALGDGPASLAPWSAPLARMLGHAGPIVTDALGMKGASAEIGIGEAAVRALLAGATLLCLDAPQERDAERTLAEAVEAIDAAVSQGRLDVGLLRAAAETNTVLKRAEFPSLGGAAEAEAEVDRLGRIAADRALTTVGDVTITGPARFVDLRRNASLAAGRWSPALADAFAAARPGEPEPGATPVAVVSRTLTSPEEAQALADLLAEHPETVVIHTGVREAAPSVPRLVCTLGAARPNAQAAMSVILR